MNTPKYYTPSIEEFCIGFEYEERPIRCAEFEGWVSQVVHIGGSSPESILRNAKVRVKHLDEVDFLRLGLDLIDASNDTFHYQNEEYIVYHHVKKNLVIILVGLAPELRFKGVVKNVSELKRILSQVKYS